MESLNKKETRNIILLSSIALVIVIAMELFVLPVKKEYASKYGKPNKFEINKKVLFDD